MRERERKGERRVGPGLLKLLELSASESGDVYSRRDVAQCGVKNHMQMQNSKRNNLAFLTMQILSDE